MTDIVFRKGLFQQLPLLPELLALLNRPLYSADVLEQTLKEQYGEEETLLDASYASSIGARVILPAARSPVPSILLFTNYNASGVRASGGETPTSGESDPLGRWKSNSARVDRGLGYDVQEACNAVTISDV